jgi:hypothetical protein
MVEMNLLAPPLSLPLSTSSSLSPSSSLAPIIPPAPVFKYSKKSVGNDGVNSADLMIDTNTKSASNSNNSNNNSNNNNNNDNNNDNNNIEKVFELFWDSEWPRMGEREGGRVRGSMGEAGEGEGGKEGEGEKNNSDNHNDNNYDNNKNFTFWNENNQPSEGWKNIPKKDQFRSILEGNKSIIKSTESDNIVSDNSKNLISVCENAFQFNSHKKEIEKQKEKLEEKIDERKSLIEILMKKYDKDQNDENGNDNENENEIDIKDDTCVSENYENVQVMVDDINDPKTESPTGQRIADNFKDIEYYKSSIERNDVEGEEKKKEKEKEKEEEKEEEKDREKSDSESENESESEEEEEEDEITQNNSNSKKDGNSGITVEDNSNMVYSRIHGYRIHVPETNDSKSFYKKILGGLREVNKTK